MHVINMLKMTIFYDNYCPNCTRFVNLIQKLDWLKFVEAKQLRNFKHMNSAVGISKTLAEKEMASFDGKWSYGYTTLFKIFLRIPIFWIFIPLLLFLKISGIGQVIYKELALKRKIIPIHCNENSCKIP